MNIGAKQAPTPPVGTTVPDLILRVLGSPFLVVPLLLIVAGVIVLTALGFVELSWGDSGLKLTQGQGFAATDVNIAGDWRATGRDLSDAEHKLTAKYTYNISASFVERGANVELKGSYSVSEDHNRAQRNIRGRGVLNGDYLSLLYDIETVQPAKARTHGTMLLHFEPSSRAATGYYLTRSMANDGFVFGTLEFTR